MPPAAFILLLIAWSVWWLIFAATADNRGRKKLAIAALILSFPLGWVLLLLIIAIKTTDKILDKL